MVGRENPGAILEGAVEGAPRFGEILRTLYIYTGDRIMQKRLDERCLPTAVPVINREVAHQPERAVKKAKTRLDH